MIRSVLIGILTAALLLTFCACGLPQQSIPEGTASETFGASTASAETSVQSESPAETSALTEAPAETSAQTESPSAAADTAQGEAQVRVQWMRDAALTDGAYDTFEAVSDPQVQIVVTTDRTVRNVRILSLFANGVDDDGNLQFDRTELYRQSTLTPDRPLVIATTFFGDLPNNGFAYTDADGTEKQFSVDISGEDGSLGLYPF